MALIVLTDRHQRTTSPENLSVGKRNAQAFTPVSDQLTDIAGHIFPGVIPEKTWVIYKTNDVVMNNIVSM